MTMPTQVILCFGPDTHSEHGMRFNVLAANAQDKLTPVRTMESRATMRKALAYLGATADQLADFDTQMHRWGQGSIHLTLLPGRKNLLGLRVAER